MEVTRSKSGSSPAALPFPFSFPVAAVLSNNKSPATGETVGNVPPVRGSRLCRKRSQRSGRPPCDPTATPRDAALIGRVLCEEGEKLIDTRDVNDDPFCVFSRSQLQAES
jgi:hypothetical protein